MAYKLNQITIRANNSKDSMQSISELWHDIENGTIPLLFNSNHIFQRGLSPISKYSNYSSDKNGDYDLTIMTVSPDFFKNMEFLIQKGLYKKYDEKNIDGDINLCTKNAWSKVWNDERFGKIKRSFLEDYESTVPKEYTKDGYAHCYLYISIE